MRLSAGPVRSREIPMVGREPPVDKAGSAQFLVPISNYNGLPFRTKTKSRIFLANL
jgi:hypothetical protein